MKKFRNEAKNRIRRFYYFISVLGNIGLGPKNYKHFVLVHSVRKLVLKI